MKVILCNFRCFKAVKTYEFADSNVNLLMGPSGAGKSTVLEGIRWCLYGNLRGIYPSGFTPTATNKTYVTVELNDLKITRSQAPEQLKVIFLPNKLLSKNKVSEDELIQEAAQQYIDGRFGNKNTWLASSFIRQGERCPLMVANNTERMTLLNEILFGNDNTSQYENPDFYTDKIEEEIEKIEKQVTGETAIFNSNYHKYVSALNSFENTYGWSKMDLETIADYEMHCNRTDHRKRMIEKQLLSVQNLENRRKMLEDRLVSLGCVVPVSETEISELRSQIVGLNTQISQNKTLLNTLTYNQAKMESLSSEILNLKSKFNPEIASQVSKPVKSSELTALKNEYRRVQNDELQVNNLEFQLNSTIKDKESIESELNTYSEIGTDLTKISKLINHQVSVEKYNSLVKELGVCPNLILTREEIPSKRRELETCLFNAKQVNEVCTRYGISPKDIASTLISVTQVIEFNKLQRVHLSRKSVIDTLKSQIETYRSSLKEETDINSGTLQEEIKLITSRLGSPLKCPGCACKLEYRNNGLFVIGNEIIDRQEGLKRIESLKEQLKVLDSNAKIRLTIDTLKHKLEVSEPYEEVYTSAPVSYTPEQITGYERLVKDLERVTGVSFIETDITGLNTQLEQLNQLEKYYKLKLEVETLQSSIDWSLEGQTSQSIEELRKALASIPLLLSRKTRLTESYDFSVKSLSTIRERLGTQTSSEILSFIQVMEAENSEAEQFNKTLEIHKSLQQNIERLEREISSLNVNSLEIEELKLKIPELELQKTSLETHINTLVSELARYKEYSSLETELKSIVIQNSSEELLKDLENHTREMKTYEEMLRKAKEMYELYKQQTELEGLHSSLTTLTTNQTNLNTLKNLIVEVSNSTLQSLVDTINNTTNTILEELFDNSIVVELKLYKEMKTKHKVKPIVNISVYYNGNVYDNVNSLSGGEKDRVSLAMTLALATIHTSPVVFLDECMSALDSSLREECLETIKKFLVEMNHKTVINIEHGACEGLYDFSVMV